MTANSLFLKFDFVNNQLTKEEAMKKTITAITLAGVLALSACGSTTEAEPAGTVSDTTRVTSRVTHAQESTYDAARDG